MEIWSWHIYIAWNKRNQSWFIYNWLNTWQLWDFWLKLDDIQKEWVQVVSNLLDWNFFQDLFITDSKTPDYDLLLSRFYFKLSDWSWLVKLIKYG